MARARAGVVLLEVMIALTILAVIGERAADDELRRASGFLDAVALWTGDDLTRHLGEHRQGAWRLRIDRQAEQLYAVTLLDSNATTAFLRTLLYRPGSSHGMR